MFFFLKKSLQFIFNRKKKHLGQFGVFGFSFVSKVYPHPSLALGFGYPRCFELPRTVWAPTLMRQPPGESDMAVSDALLPSFSTFASGPAGREKTLRPAGAPNNVSAAASRPQRPGWGRAEPWGHLEPPGEGKEWPPRTDCAAVPGWLLRPWPGVSVRVVPAPRSRQGRTAGPHMSQGAQAVGWARARGG